MALVFRDEKGSPLTPEEVDENFRTLLAMVDGFVVPDGRGISSVTVAGNTFSIVLTDASTQGPFPLPERPAFEWRGEWVGGTDYDPWDVFTVEGDGVYLVQREYSAPTEFDPSVSDTDGPLLTLMLGIPPDAVMQVTHSSESERTLTTADAGSYIRFEDVGPTDVLVQSEADQNWVEGNVITFRRAGGPVSFLADGTDVVIVPPIDCLPQLRTEGSTGTLVYVGGDVWDLSGDLLVTGTT